MKKSGLIAVSLVIVLSLLTACGGGMGAGAGDTPDQPDWEELVGAINELEVKVASLEKENADLQDIVTTVSEHLLAAEGNITDHEGRLSTVENNNALLLNPYLSVETGTINGLSGPHVILHDANLHIQNGSGATTMINGVGNLVVGYNEDPGDLDPGDRSGSHNLIVGSEHNYSSYGGFLAGYRNTVSTQFASVSGGRYNTASGWYSSVSGGRDNTASGYCSSISGGSSNTASSSYASVSGGWYNTASGDASSVSGGGYNTASGQASSVSGGQYNWASGGVSSVSGGSNNFAFFGYASSVSGGIGRSASGDYDWAAGGLWEDN